MTHTHIELKARVVQESASAHAEYARELKDAYYKGAFNVSSPACIIRVQEDAAHLYATARELMGVTE